MHVVFLTTPMLVHCTVYGSGVYGCVSIQDVYMDYGWVVVTCVYLWHT